MLHEEVTAMSLRDSIWKRAMRELSHRNKPVQRGVFTLSSVCSTAGCFVVAHVTPSVKLLTPNSLRYNSIASIVEGQVGVVGPSASVANSGGCNPYSIWNDGPTTEDGDVPMAHDPDITQKPSRWDTWCADLTPYPLLTAQVTDTVGASKTLITHHIASALARSSSEIFHRRTIFR